MTALSEYERLEAAGIWRAHAKAQRINVFVSVGEASLTISDGQNRPLAHWSLAAIERMNPGKRPALYHPNGDNEEQLELPEEASDIIEAIEKLRAAVERARPHPGRLRLFIIGTAFVCLAAILTLWLPNALRDHATAMLPDANRKDISGKLRLELQRVTGPVCDEADGEAALTNLSERLTASGLAASIDVVRSGVRDTILLPDGSVIVSRSLVEDFEEPDVLAGYVIVEQLRGQLRDPLDELLEHAGVWSNIRLLTTGSVPQDALESYAEYLLVRSKPQPTDDMVLARFSRAAIRSSPYAYARDVTGEKTISLIEADPFAAKQPKPLLSDADWLQLQAICGA
ncbi:MAG: hypothetical protein AAGF53_01900 [Pseudomonadota bacterium]